MLEHLDASVRVCELYVEIAHYSGRKNLRLFRLLYEAEIRRKRLDLARAQLACNIRHRRSRS